MWERQHVQGQCTMHIIVFNPLSCCPRCMAPLFVYFLNKHDFCMYPENPPRPLESLLLNREMGAFIFCLVLIIRIRIIFSFQSFPSQLFLFSLWLTHFPDLISRIKGCSRCFAFCQMILLFVTKRKTYCNLARLVVPLSG